MNTSVTKFKLKSQEVFQTETLWRKSIIKPKENSQMRTHSSACWLERTVMIKSFWTLATTFTEPMWVRLTSIFINPLTISIPKIKKMEKMTRMTSNKKTPNRTRRTWRLLKNKREAPSHKSQNVNNNENSNEYYILFDRWMIFVFLIILNRMNFYSKRRQHVGCFLIL